MVEEDCEAAVNIKCAGDGGGRHGGTRKGKEKCVKCKTAAGERAEERRWSC